MLPWASEAIADTSPNLYCGGSFGQDLSTSKVGKLRVCTCAAWAWASVVAHLPCTTATATDAAIADAGIDRTDIDGCIFVGSDFPDLRYMGLNPEFCFSMQSGGATPVLSVLMALVSLRVKAIFYTMMTLAVAAAFGALVTRMSWLTGGDDGRNFRLPEALTPGFKVFSNPFLRARNQMYCSNIHVLTLRKTFAE